MGDPKSFTYRKVEGWGNSIQGFPLPGMVTSMALDKDDLLYALVRTPRDQPAVHIFETSGKHVGQWGEGIFTETHGIRVTDKGAVWITDREDHTVREFTKDGKLVRTLGTIGKTGAPGQPFNMPTNTAVSRAGDLFVSDGYGQTRVHRFSKDGKLIESWGEKGSGDGQLLLPHGIWVDERDRVLVADRYNARVTVFDIHGKYLEAWPVKNANDIWIRDGLVYVTEGPLTIWSMDGKLLHRWVEYGTHSVCVDKKGAVYLNQGHGKEDAILQKYDRV